MCTFTDADTPTKRSLCGRSEPLLRTQTKHPLVQHSDLGLDHQSLPGWLLTLRNHLTRCQWLSTAYQALARDAMPLKHKQQLQQQVNDTVKKTVQYLKWLQLNPWAIFQGLQPNDLFESGSRIAPVDNKRILATLTNPHASHLQIAAVLHKGAQQYTELFKQQATRIRAHRAATVQKPDMRSACSQLKNRNAPPLLRTRVVGPDGTTTITTDPAVVDQVAIDAWANVHKGQCWPCRCSSACRVLSWRLWGALSFFGPPLPFPYYC